MKLFCIHDYELICKTYSEPNPILAVKISGYGVERMIEKFLYGITSVLLKCRKCGKIL